MLTGQTIGPYDVLHEIGRGGMGVVYLAEHRHLKRKAAIKLLPRELTRRAEVLARFFTEARATSIIQHPGIVQVLDCDLDVTGHAYIVMEYLEGKTLGAHLAERGRLPFPDAASLMLGVTRALAAAHAKGIVHRDLKPDNIFLPAHPPGSVKIMDFGIAKLAAADRPPSRTLSGVLLGTPLYMSPEQARGAGAVDHRADLYSLGCIFYEVLCGQPPFPPAGIAELIAAHLHHTPPSPHSLEPSLPPRLSALVENLLAKSPQQRPPSADALIPAIEEYATGGGGAHSTLLIPPPAAPLTPPAGGAASAASGPAVAPPREATIELPTDRTGTPGFARARVPDRTGTAGFARFARARLGARPTPRPGEGRARWALLAGVAGGLAMGAVALWSATDRAPRESALSSTPVPSITATPPRAPRAAPPPSPPVIPTRPLTPAAEPPDPEPRPRPPSTVQLSLATSPADAAICLGDDRLGTTPRSLQLRRQRAPRKLLVYRAGYRLERLEVPGDRDVRRSISLRALGNDDLQDPAPCR